MKKNLVSILILALLVVNVVLTAIMMFSVTGSAKKTSALVTSIAEVLNIELAPLGETPEEPPVKIADVVPYDIKESLTIPLKRSVNPDGTTEDKTHYFLVSVSFYMNSKHEDYETYNPTVANNESLFKSTIIEVISNHTLEEIQADPEAIRNEILLKIQKMYESTFIYKVAFSNVMYQ